MVTLKFILKLLLAFFCGSGVYLWLALSNCPLFRIEDLEPAQLFHVLMYSSGSRYSVFLFVASIWGIIWVAAYLLHYSIVYKNQRNAILPNKLFLTKPIHTCVIAINATLFVCFLVCFITLVVMPFLLEARISCRSELLVELIVKYKESEGCFPSSLNELLVKYSNFDRNILYGADGELVVYKCEEDICHIQYNLSNNKNGSKYINVVIRQ